MLPPLTILWCFPVVAAILFAKLPPLRALVVAMVGGYLLLPEKTGFDLPILPFVEKDAMVALSVLVAMMLALPKLKAQSPHLILPGWLPKSAVVNGLMACVIFGTLGTVLTNGEPLVFELITIPALRLYDWGSLALSAVFLFLPFLLARRFLGHPDSHVLVMTVLVAAALGYSVLAIYEARMSPQLNIRLYGFFQHEWNQHVRGGGFRPIVFLQHGLWVSAFFATATLAALVLYRDQIEKKSFYALAAAWLLITIIVTKSLGVLVIALLLGPLLFLGSPRSHLITAAVLAGVVITYPFLRGAGLIPIEQISAWAHSIDPNRALSLSTRLFNEEQFLIHTQAKPLFGWGTWGRNFVYDARGITQNVADGYWVIAISTRGWVGYVGIFGLLAFGIIGLLMKAQAYQVGIATTGLALVLAGNLVDLIPNATLTPITWLMAGALVGRLEHGRITAKDGHPEPEPAGPRYTRFGPPKGAATPLQSPPNPNQSRYARH